MKVFQIQDDWGMEHLKPATRPDPRPGPGPGQVLLQGTGGVALFALQFVKLRGAHFGKICIRH